MPTTTCNKNRRRRKLQGVRLVFRCCWRPFRNTTCNKELRGERWRVDAGGGMRLFHLYRKFVRRYKYMLEGTFWLLESWSPDCLSMGGTFQRRFCFMRLCSKILMTVRKNSTTSRLWWQSCCTQKCPRSAARWPSPQTEYLTCEAGRTEDVLRIESKDLKHKLEVCNLILQTETTSPH